MIIPKNNLSLLRQQVWRFGRVGLVALIVHWGTALILMAYGQKPLIANTFAFLIAFQLSYWGHRYWTFEGSELSHKTALLRFLAIAVAGFLLNQILFASLLKFTQLPHSLALLIVLVLVSANNFVFSKFWAFRSNTS